MILWEVFQLFLEPYTLPSEIQSMWSSPDPRMCFHLDVAKVLWLVLIVNCGTETQSPTK